MALVDLKSKLSNFGKNNPKNPSTSGKEGYHRHDQELLVFKHKHIGKITDSYIDKRGRRYKEPGENVIILEDTWKSSEHSDINTDRRILIGEKPESNLIKIDSEYDREHTPKSIYPRRDHTRKSSIKEFVQDFGLAAYDVPISKNYEDSIKLGSTEAFGGISRLAKSIENTVKGAKDILKGNVSKGIRNVLEQGQERKLDEYRAIAYGRIRKLGDQGRKVSNVDTRLSIHYEGPIKGGETSKNVNLANMEMPTDVSYKTHLQMDVVESKDIIPFRFKDFSGGAQGEWVTFSAILSGITDTITPEWNADRFVGRPDNVYTYQGATRSISFTFDIFPMTRQEMKPLWTKLNRLVGMCYPNWTPAYGGQAMTAPIVQLTIGNMYKEQPGFLSNVAISVPDSSTWEIEKDLKLPHYVQVACDFTYIGSELLKGGKEGKHFDLNWIPINLKDPLRNKLTTKQWFAMNKAGRKAKSEARGPGVTFFGRREAKQNAKIDYRQKHGSVTRDSKKN